MWPFKKGGKSTTSGHVLVLGTQLAAAQREEEVRSAKGNLPSNPITPDMAYIASKGELDLIDVQPLPADGKLAELCHRYASSDTTVREAMRAGVPMNGLYTLITFARRSAALALRENDVGRIQDGLTALSIIEQNRVDFRDLLVTLGLLHGAALQNGENADELTLRMARIAEASTRELMTSFVQRSAKDKDMRSMGFTTLRTETGLAVVNWSYDSYAPTCAIDRVALALGDLIRADKYEPSLTLGQNMPAVWLARPDDRALAHALAKTVAGATLNGTLRPGECPEYRSQQLTIFLIELADEASADALLNLADAKMAQKGAVAMVAHRQGRLFCLAIARAFQMGKEPFETTESLSRFGPGIAAALLRQ